MVKKAFTAIDNIKIWLFAPMLAVILWFCREFYLQQENIGNDVDEIKLEVQAHTLKVESLEKRISDQEFMTKQFFRWQLEKHKADQEDTIYYYDIIPKEHQP